MFVFCFCDFMWPSVYFFIFNLCSIDHSSTALCVAAFFAFILVFAACVSAYKLPASKGKTCPDFSLSTNKFFCVKIIVLFVFDFWFPLLWLHVYPVFTLPSNPSATRIVIPLSSHFISVLICFALPFAPVCCAKYTICNSNWTFKWQKLSWFQGNVYFKNTDAI